ncbi:MAG: hypothetical protein K8R92_05090 [Planctomycetes bacterium]|nr:hypothetical protein [Planctomycetota bacterium]
MKNSYQIVSTLLTISFAGVASASVSGAQGLYAHNYLVTDAGVQYSVMDVFLKFNSASGTGTQGERMVNLYGQATTDASTFGVNKTSKFTNSLGLNFQHSNVSWLPGSGANGGTGNNTWDSFMTVGARTQGAGNTGNVAADSYFTNPNSNVGSIIGGFNATPLFVGAGVTQNSPSDAGFETNASANADHMIMIGRYSLKTSDILANGGTATMAVWFNWTGKSTAQTGGTTLYTMASANVKSDAQTKYTISGKTWTFDPSFDGVVGGQAAWSFYAPPVPTPGVVALLGLAGLMMRRRK